MDGEPTTFPAAPRAFLSVRMVDAASDPPLMALCAGYERGHWRRKALGRYLFNHLNEFAFKWSELQRLDSSTALDMIAEAARRVYASRKFESRGEFGELLLHAVLRSHFRSQPAASKIFFKTADNETVKGYDCVHIVPTATGIELWFGEAKFYSNIATAISDAVSELMRHTTTDYLRREFALIQGKVDGPYADDIRRMLEPEVSLDEIFEALRIPVLLTYDSRAVGNHDGVTAAYRAALEKEIRHYYSLFVRRSAGLPREVQIHVILVPLRQKKALVRHLDTRLREIQGSTQDEADDEDFTT
ncbi:MAG: hypothetical protein JWQ48_204 [Conexibacter sp.]|nr:hypothetical protein [Conexibacter sp.]